MPPSASTSPASVATGSEEGAASNVGSVGEAGEVCPRTHLPFHGTWHAERTGS